MPLASILVPPPPCLQERSFMENQRKVRRLVLFPVPLQGHLNPMLQLANVLHSGGFSIAIIHTRFNSPDRSKYPQFTFHPITDGLSESETSTADVIALVSLLNANCALPFRDCLARLLSDASEDDPIACLITDALWHFSQSIADSFKLPRIVLRTSSISSFLAFAAVSQMREKGYLPLSKQDSQLVAPVEDQALFKDSPIIRTREPEALYKLTADITKGTMASSGIIWNTFEELEPSALVRVRQVFPPQSFPVGPFHKYFPASSSSLLEHDQSAISWLDTQAPKSVLYVSFGSIVAVDETEFLDMAWGLAGSMLPFLWVVRPGLVRGSEWLEPLPTGFMEKIHGRGHIVKWAPQQEVLPHPATGGFWTHSGWNSTLESICEGVPMICSPCFGDQLVNARYISDVWRIGLRFENAPEKGAVEKTIRRVMVEKEGEEMRERLQHLKEKVDLCLKQGGSSHRYLESLINYISSF